MAKLIILTGDYDGARAWAETWKKSHPQGEVFDEYEDEMHTLVAAEYMVEAYDADVVVIPNTLAEIQLLDFAPDSAAA